MSKAGVSGRAAIPLELPNPRVIIGLCAVNPARVAPRCTGVGFFVTWANLWIGVPREDIERLVPRRRRSALRWWR